MVKGIVQQFWKCFLEFPQNVELMGYQQVNVFY